MVELRKALDAELAGAQAEKSETSGNRSTPRDQLTSRLPCEKGSRRFLSGCGDPRPQTATHPIFSISMLRPELDTRLDAQKGEIEACSAWRDLQTIRPLQGVFRTCTTANGGHLHRTQSTADDLAHSSPWNALGFTSLAVDLGRLSGLVKMSTTPLSSHCRQVGSCGESRVCCVLTSLPVKGQLHSCRAGGLQIIA